VDIVIHLVIGVFMMPTLNLVLILKILRSCGFRDKTKNQTTKIKLDQEKFTLKIYLSFWIAVIQVDGQNNSG